MTNLLALVAAVLALVLPLKAPESAPIQPVSGQVASELGGMKVDAQPESRLQEAHYIKGNEYDMVLFFDSIRSLGGALVGIGSDQSFTLAEVARSNFIFIFDYDLVVVQEMELYCTLLRRASSPEELIGLWGDRKLAEKVEGMIREDFGPDFKQYRKLHSRWGKAVAKHLTSSLELARKGRQPHWLGTGEGFAYIKQMVEAGRVVVRFGDLTGGVTVTAIGDFLKKQGIPLMVLYLSNAEEYWSRYSKGMEESLLALPLTEGTRVLRTFHDTRLPKAQPQDFYHYNVQSGASLRDYVGRKGLLRYRAMMKDVRISPDKPEFSTLGL